MNNDKASEPKKKLSVLAVIDKGFRGVLTLIGLTVVLAEGCKILEEPLLNRATPDESLKKAAGCLIVDDHGVNGYLMLGVLTSVEVNEAKNVNQEGKLVFSPPGGSFKGEDRDTMETAIRETLEETGYTVKIEDSQPLETFQNGSYVFDLFRCSIDRSVEISRRDGEIQGLVWVDPRGMEEGVWRFVSQRDRITELYNKLSSDSALR